MYGLIFSYAVGTCPAVPVKQLLDDEAAVGIIQHQNGPLFACNYVTGQRLLDEFSTSMGEAAFNRAWKEIQRIAASGPSATDAKIYETFLSHTSSDKIGVFEAAYANWQKGNFN